MDTAPTSGTRIPASFRRRLLLATMMMMYRRHREPDSCHLLPPWIPYGQRAVPLVATTKSSSEGESEKRSRPYRNNQYTSVIDGAAAMV